jgi:hypothetical protein
LVGRWAVFEFSQCGATPLHSACRSACEGDHVEVLRADGKNSFRYYETDKQKPCQPSHVEGVVATLLAAGAEFDTCDQVNSPR